MNYSFWPKEVCTNFRRGLLHSIEGNTATNRSGDVKIGYFSLMAS